MFVSLGTSFLVDVTMADFTVMYIVFICMPGDVYSVGSSGPFKIQDDFIFTSETLSMLKIVPALQQTHTKTGISK